MNSVPVSKLDSDLIRLAFLNHQEKEKQRMEAYVLMQQQLDRMATEAGVDLKLYTFSLDTNMFEPIPVPVPVANPDTPCETGPSNVVDFPAPPIMP